MVENEKINLARIALIVTGDNLPMERISQLLELQPPRVIHSGDLLNKLPEIRAQDDEWIHMIDLDTPNGRDEHMKELLIHLMQHKPQLDEVRGMGEARLRLRVQSDYAQMVYGLEPETIHELYETGLALDVSSVSWGEIGI